MQPRQLKTRWYADYFETTADIRAEVTRSSFETAGDWPGTIAAMVVRSLRSKLCLSPSPTGFETASIGHCAAIERF
jgi:hypothetical protein